MREYAVVLTFLLAVSGCSSGTEIAEPAAATTTAAPAATTTAAPAATTTAAPAATTTATPEEVALANLANIGWGAFGDEYYIKNVRQTMSVNDNNMYSDLEIFDIAKGICYGAITSGIGPIVGYLQEVLQTEPRKNFVSQLALSYNAIFWYCDDYVYEFEAAAKKEGW